MAQNIPSLLRNASQQYSQGTATPIVAPLQTEEKDSSSMGVLKGMMAKGGAAQKLAQQRTLENQKGLQKLLSETDTGFQGLLQTLAIGAGNKLGQMSKEKSPDDEMLKAQGIDAIHGTLAASKDPNNPEQYFLAAQQLIGLGEPERAASMMAMGNTLYDNNLATQTANKPTNSKSMTAVEANKQAIKQKALNQYGVTLSDEDALSISQEGVGTQVSDGSIINMGDRNLERFMNRNNISRLGQTSTQQNGALPNSNIDNIQKTERQKEKEKQARLDDINDRITKISTNTNVTDSIAGFPLLASVNKEMGKYFKRKDVSDENGQIGDFIYDPEVDIPQLSMGEALAFKAKSAVGLAPAANPLVTSFNALRNELLADRSGAAVTEPEFNRLSEEIFGNNMYGLNEETFVMFLNRLNKRQEAKWGSFVSALGKEAGLEFFKRNNFVTQTDPDTGDVYRESFPNCGRYVKFN